eukprot:COSAG05_NODE_1599_length_4452_cov_2.249024_5_plen_161_part_00
MLEERERSAPPATPDSASAQPLPDGNVDSSVPPSAFPETAESAARDTLAGFDRVEVNPAGLALAQEIARRLRTRGGAALIVDYGEDRTYADSLQAVKQHQYPSLLVSFLDASSMSTGHCKRLCSTVAPLLYPIRLIGIPSIWSAHRHLLAVVHVYRRWLK